MGASHFLKVCHGRKEGLPPRLDIGRELAVQNSVRELIRAGIVKSAHDCSEGGLAVALAEACFNPHGLLGADVDCSRRPASHAEAFLRRVGGAASPDASHNSESFRESGDEAATVLFNEAQSRIVISCAPREVEKVVSTLQSKSIPHSLLGQVANKTLLIKEPGSELSWSIEDLYDDWFNAIRRAVETETEPAPSL